MRIGRYVTLKNLRRFLASLSLSSTALFCVPGMAASKPWEHLPELRPDTSMYQHAQVNGVRLAYSEVGQGSPVIVLHGGPANASYLSGQVQVLRAHHRVISIDTRGHGRSTLGETPLGYNVFADDVVALMAHLQIAKADIVGWSDGAITGLDMAMRHPDKVGKVLAFGANVRTSGTYADADSKPAFAAFLARAPEEYRKLSPTPEAFGQLDLELQRMYATQPNWTTEQLNTIKSKVLVVDGEHDEVIRPEHTRDIAQSIPGAKLVFIEDTSHFAFLQAPEAFNKVMLDFLEGA